MKQAASRPESYTKKVALVLQGGGALGSYQAGVYEALASSGWPGSRSAQSICGIGRGINSHDADVDRQKAGRF